MTANERSGWRDERISRRHRKWGFHCPGTDLDFTLVEFNAGNPVAVVDYKLWSKPDPFKGVNPMSLRAMASLFNERGENLPFVVCRYWPDVVDDGDAWAFEAFPMNKPARELFPNPDAWTSLSEKDWVEGLLKIRRVEERKWTYGRTVELCTTLPPEAQRNGARNLPPVPPMDESFAAAA